MFDPEYSDAGEATQAGPVDALSALGSQGELLAQLRSVAAIGQMADLYGQRFVLWRGEAGKDGKPIKKPKRLDGRPNASSTDDTTWNTMERCCAALPHTPAGTGLGVILAAERDAANGVLILVGVDLDGCRDPDTGEIKPWAWEIIRALDSYTEVSPSGTGVKVYLQVERDPELPANKLVIAKAADGGKAEQTDIFKTVRFFAIAGQHLLGTPATLQVRTGAFAALAAE